MCVLVAQSCPSLCDPMEFFRPEYWSGYPFPSPGDPPNLGIKPRSPALQADSLPAEPFTIYEINSKIDHRPIMEAKAKFSRNRKKSLQP